MDIQWIDRQIDRQKKSFKHRLMRRSNEKVCIINNVLFSFDINFSIQKKFQTKT